MKRKKLPIFVLKISGEKPARQMLETICDVWIPKASMRRFARQLEKQLDKKCPNWRGVYGKNDMPK